MSKVIVSGGSVFLSEGQSGFDGHAYGNDEDAAAGTNEVFMRQIDLTGYHLTNQPVEKMTMYIDGVLQPGYGSASYVHPNGSLYLWLPGSGAGKESKVSLDINDAAGHKVDMEDFVLPSSETGILLKQYAKFGTKNPDGTTNDHISSGGNQHS